MKAIVAVNKNWGIGLNNDLLYCIPEDKKYFRRMTINKTVIMGRKTLLSLPNSKPFKDRNNIVFSRNPDFTAEGVTVCTDRNHLRNILRNIDGADVFVVGGEEIYNLLLPFCDTVYVTKIDDDTKQADKFFPNLDELYEWKLTDCSEEYEYEGLKYKFCTYTDITHL